MSVCIEILVWHGHKVMLSCEGLPAQLTVLPSLGMVLLQACKAAMGGCAVQADTGRAQLRSAATLQAPKPISLPAKHTHACIAASHLHTGTLAYVLFAAASSKCAWLPIMSQQLGFVTARLRHSAYGYRVSRWP